MKSTKKSQSEVITTVLLILLSIAAVVLVSSFVINMIKNNLKGTECFQTMGQIEIAMDGGNTWFNQTSNEAFVSISRGSKDFNLSKILIIYGNELTTQKIEVQSGATYTNIFYSNITGGWDNHNFMLPGSSELRTYKIINTSMKVSRVSVVPVLAGSAECDKADEKEIPSFS